MKPAASTLLLISAALAWAQVSKFTNEAEYLAAAASAGYTISQEGFEDNAVWGPARAPQTAAAIVSQGILWASNHPNAVRRSVNITTGDGAARTGKWGIYSLPHGDPDVVAPFAFMRDGFTGTRLAGASRLYGVGGWFTGFPGSKIAVALDGDEAKLFELGRLSGAGHQFFGLLDRRGFAKFEIRELEGKLEDQKFVFADDFSFAAASAGLSALVSVSAASFLAGAPLAPGSIATAFGAGLAGATSVRVRDSAGVERAAAVLFVSPGQINYVMPEGTASGWATVTVLRGQQAVASGAVRIEPVAPGLFTANADGKGVAAAYVVRAAAGGSQTIHFTFQCGTVPASCVPAPVELGPDTIEAVLVLFGTGIRGRSALSAVSVKAGGTEVETLYAGPQSEFAGLDQANVRLPLSLHGEVEVALTVDRRAANPVRVSFR